MSSVVGALPVAQSPSRSLNLIESRTFDELQPGDSASLVRTFTYENVAILPAVEIVTAGIPSTIDAAASCTMADRGQISGAILDGPLDSDNASPVEAASIASPAAGRADILVVPDLESGNMLAKQLEDLAHVQVAGVVLGARVAINLTSRADQTLARLVSGVMALLLAQPKADAP